MAGRGNRFVVRRSAAAGLLAGAVVGSTILVIVGSAIAQGAADSADPYVEATHLPRLLTTAGAVELEVNGVRVRTGDLGEVVRLELRWKDGEVRTAFV